ncbi:titin [Nephila pilipes]|uniref:Titin n=1 Tax=Nephila pilipes TaxID=299642 RepID=A0A8X6QSY2_NEPPI|nr:titin [Nephila pilipes]
MDALIFLRVLVVYSCFIVSQGLKPPKIKPFHFSGELNVGLRTVVMCAVIDGSPPFDFQWLKDSRPLTSSGGRFSVESFNEFTSILTISDLDSESNGNYTCRVSNSAGSDEKSDSLNMRGFRTPTIKPFNFSGVLSEGRRTAVMCVVTDGDVPFTFSWFKDGKPLQSEEGHFSIQLFDEFTSILTIKKLDSDSNGNYTCRVTNSVGSDEKSDILIMRGNAKDNPFIKAMAGIYFYIAVVLIHSAAIEGSKPPRIKPFNFSGELSQGLRTAVMCVIIDGDRPFDFIWFKDGAPLVPQEGHFSVESVNKFTSILTIEHLNSDSNGNYSCRVTNSVGSDQKSDVLMMKGLKPPKIMPFHFSGELNEGLRVAVMCVIIDGDRPLDFKWFKDGDLLSPEKSHFSVQIFNEFTSILTIEQLSADSNGNYTCRVTNSAGSDEKSDVLTMKGETWNINRLRHKGIV